MLLVFTAAICLLITFILKTRTHDSGQLIEPRAASLTIAVQIICGDCCGDENRPIKTLLGRGGNCAQCGGSSYMLASRRGVTTNHILEIALQPRQDAPRATRARPQGASPAYRTIVPVPARNPWIASSKLVNQDFNHKAS